MRIDFLGLQGFLSIAERGSFQRAAAHLNLSQTALSHRLKKLEDDLGVQLLVRTTRQVGLTSAGQDLLPKARRLIEGIETCFDDLRAQAKGSSPKLSIGCLPTLAMHYLPALLHDLRKIHPDVTVQVFDNSAHEIGELVQAGTAEFGLTIVSAHRWDMEITPLFKEPFVLACPVTHEFAAQKSINWTQLETIPLIRISPQAGNRALIDDALGSRREKLTWAIEVQHVSSAVSMVRAGLGLTIVPRLSIEAGQSGIAAVPLHNPGISRTLGLISRRGIPLSAPATTLAEMICRAMKGRREE